MIQRRGLGEPTIESSIDAKTSIARMCTIIMFRPSSL